ncbi:MAG: 30S ribosomal protein S2 [Acidobacteriota bacterium]
MASVSMRELLEAGVHFGHQTRRWNPKMKRYIFARRKGIYIVDLRQTVTAFQEAMDFLEEVASDGGSVLFVGTKRQAQEAIADAAGRCGMYFVNHRWLGGLLTNFETIRRSIGRLHELEEMGEDGRMELLPKKEVISLRREQAKLQRNLAGIKEMGVLPNALFVVDVRRERIAIQEAMKLGIPIVAIVDTNCDPEGIDFVIPGNDDALRAIRLFVGLAAEAIDCGRKLLERDVEELATSANGGEGGPPSQAQEEAHGEVVAEEENESRQPK